MMALGLWSQTDLGLVSSPSLSFTQPMSVTLFLEHLPRARQCSRCWGHRDKRDCPTSCPSSRYYSKQGVTSKDRLV